MRTALLLLVSVIYALSYVPPSLGCCSLQPAAFSGTRGLAAEVMMDGQLVHVLGYKNVVSGMPNRSSGGNAMLLPIPAQPGTMTDKNIVDTNDCRNMFADLENAVWPPQPMEYTYGDSSVASMQGVVQVFDHGIYTIVLAQNAADIPTALSRVPESKRPALNPKIFDAYSKWYKGWTFALCCFNTKQEFNADPMLWWYKPLNPDVLFFPALDAHDGNPPDLNANVQVDHMLFVSSFKMDHRRASKVTYSDFDISNMGKWPAIAQSKSRPFLPEYALGKKYETRMRNGDFVFRTADVCKGICQDERRLPPFAPTNRPRTGK